MKLDKAKIAEGGLSLLEQGGLENLSTRKLADHFGIKSASLYYHFKNKQQLLDHVADAMIRPAWRSRRADESWQAWLTDTAKVLRRLMLAYPDGALVCAGASPPDDRVMSTSVLIYEPLLNTGLSWETTRFIIFSVIRFTIGWTSDEQVAHSRGTDREPEYADSGFEFGLQLIVKGVEVLIAEANKD